MTALENKTGEKSMQVLFMEIHRHHVGRCLAQLSRYGIHPSQMPFIMILHKNNGCSQKEIAERLEIKPPTVNVSIQRLEKSGFVCRRRDENDQRMMRVYLTESGKKMVDELMADARMIEKAMFAGFSEEELSTLRQFFNRILDNIDSMPGDIIKECKFMRREGLDE